MQYQGQIMDGQMHGVGKLTYENGEYYDGEWVRGKVYSFALSLFYIPPDNVSRITLAYQSLAGKRQGTGEYLYNDGSKYYGDWENDIIKGEGTSWYPNGNK